MDPRLAKKIQQRTPDINPQIAHGLAIDHMRFVEQYVDRVWGCAAPGFPDGLEYLGYQRCTPQEEYNEITRKRNNRRVYEISRSDVYLVKYFLRFNGKDMFPRYMYLPFVNEAGIINIRGSTFSVAPVLADRAISVGTDNIFIPLTRDKLTFERVLQHYMLNGKRETVNVVWSGLYRRSQRARRRAGRPTIDGRCTLFHYLLCRYGFTRTFSQFANVSVEVGDSLTITEKTHSPRQWHICQSTHLKPRGVKERYYKGSDLRIAVRKKDYNQTVSAMIGAFFYIVDHFPDRIRPENADETLLWKILLGHFIFASNDSEGRLIDGVEEHLESLDEYLDAMARDNLYEEGVYCENIYQLFAHIIDTFPERVMQQTDSVASMYGKRMTVLRYVLQPLITSIFKFMFAVQAANTKRSLTEQNVTNAMNRLLKPERIMEINHGHGEINTVSAPGDNKIFKITSQLVLQANSTGPSQNHAKANLFDPSKNLHASIAEVGSFTNLTKSDPTGRSRVNPCVRIESDGMIQRNPQRKSLIDGVQNKIKR